MQVKRRNIRFPNKLIGAFLGAIYYPPAFALVTAAMLVWTMLLSPFLIVTHFIAKFKNRRSKGQSVLFAALGTSVISPIGFALKMLHNVVSMTLFFVTFLIASPILGIKAGWTRGIFAALQLAWLNFEMWINENFKSHGINRTLYEFDQMEASKQALEEKESKSEEEQQTLVDLTKAVNTMNKILHPPIFGIIKSYTYFLFNMALPSYGDLQLMSPDIKEAINKKQFEPKENVLYVEPGIDCLSYFSSKTEKIERIEKADLDNYDISTFENIKKIQSKILKITLKRGHNSSNALIVDVPLFAVITGNERAQVNSLVIHQPSANTSDSAIISTHAQLRRNAGIGGNSNPSRSPSLSLAVDEGRQQGNLLTMEEQADKAPTTEETQETENLLSRRLQRS